MSASMCAQNNIYAKSIFVIGEKCFNFFYTKLHPKMQIKVKTAETRHHGLVHASIIAMRM